MQDLSHLLRTGDVEGVTAHCHLVQDDAQGPYIDAFVIGVSHQDLWAQVEGSAAESGSQLATSENTPAEVTHLDHSLVEHDVLWLDVAVDD